MKRRKELLKHDTSDFIFSDNRVRVIKHSNEYLFEIGKELTFDIAEAVCILMRSVDDSHDIWNLQFDKIETQNITPEKSLFWLTGGYKEWKSLEHYRFPWQECYLDFQEEFGFLIINTLEKYKKLSDIRNNFRENLSLPLLYDFAVSKSLVKLK